MGTRYLYTFEAKEIQKFILQSDKLKEMIGGSEIVSQLCGDFLKNALATLGCTNHTIVANAAGWARIIFTDEDEMKCFFAHWPLLVAQFAPGLQVIQAVVSFVEDSEISEALEHVNKQLRRERNVRMRSLPEITPLIERNPLTGLAAVTRTDATKEADKKAKLLDRQSERKRIFQEGTLTVNELIKIESGQEWPDEFDKIVDSDKNFLAIIHADGNDLGSTLIKIKEHVKKTDVDAAMVYGKFSEVIQRATVNAVQSAYDEVLKPAAKLREGIIPGRPIVLGGDDLTIIVRADLAFDFTTHFLREFESLSESLLGKELAGVVDLPKKLTACAGIAFVKKAYPFVNGYSLAESLCGYTKQQAKGTKYLVTDDVSKTEYIPSSFAFHRNTSSIAGDYGEVRQKELTSCDGKIKLWYGPYTTCEKTGGLPTFQNLEKLGKALKGLPGGSVRELIADLYVNANDAEARYERMLQVADKKKSNALIVALEELISSGAPAYLRNDGHTPLLDAHIAANLQLMTEEETDDNG